MRIRPKSEWEPRPTSYAGVMMRSRLEARVAARFDAWGMQWEYEPREVDLGDMGTYTPDFFVQGSGWVEVKPDLDSFSNAHKIERFGEWHGDEGFFLLTVNEWGDTRLEGKTWDGFEVEFIECTGCDGVVMGSLGVICPSCGVVASGVRRPCLIDEYAPRRLSLADMTSADEAMRCELARIVERETTTYTFSSATRLSEGGRMMKTKLEKLEMRYTL